MQLVSRKNLVIMTKKKTAPLSIKRIKSLSVKNAKIGELLEEKRLDSFIKSAVNRCLHLVHTHIENVAYRGCNRAIYAGKFLHPSWHFDNDRAIKIASLVARRLRKEGYKVKCVKKYSKSRYTTSVFLDLSLVIDW